MPSADCHWRWPTLLLTLYPVSLSSLCPPAGARLVAQRWPRDAEVFGKPLTSCAAFAPDRAVGSPGVLPGCFQCVTVESTAGAAASAKRLVTGTSGCVAPSSRIQTAYTHLRGVSSTRIHCAFGPHFRLWLPQGRLAVETFAIHYPSLLPITGLDLLLDRTTAS